MSGSCNKVVIDIICRGLAHSLIFSEFIIAHLAAQEEKEILERFGLRNAIAFERCPIAYFVEVFIEDERAHRPTDTCIALAETVLEMEEVYVANRY